MLVTGATGLVGEALSAELARGGTQVLALSRRPRPGPALPGVEWVQGDPAVPAAFADRLNDLAAIVHLAGEPIAEGRWTAERKQRLRDSRIATTRRLVEAMSRARVRPRVFVCASATGFYGPRGEEELDEASCPGDDFLARLCVDWEAAALDAEAAGIRVVQVRFGVVLGPGGGALGRMVPLFRWGLGGPLGPGGRWFPWIHLDDAVGLVRHAIGGDVRGPLNAVAPGVVRMREFARGLGRALGRPALVPAPLAALRLVLGELATALSPGQHVIPRRALETNYSFRQPELAPALAACRLPS